MSITTQRSEPASSPTPLSDLLRSPCLDRASDSTCFPNLLAQLSQRHLADPTAPTALRPVGPVRRGTRRGVKLCTMGPSPNGVGRTLHGG